MKIVRMLTFAILGALVSAVAGVMEQFAVLKTGWLPFVAASVLGGALTLVVTALTFQALMKRKEVA